MVVAFPSEIDAVPTLLIERKSVIRTAPPSIEVFPVKVPPMPLRINSPVPCLITCLVVPVAVMLPMILVLPLPENVKLRALPSALFHASPAKVSVPPIALAIPVLALLLSCVHACKVMP